MLEILWFILYFS